MNRREDLAAGAARADTAWLTRLPEPLLAATANMSAAMPDSTHGGVGADMPWTTYQAEDMKTTGTVLGPKYEPFLVETESSGQKCVKLDTAGEYVEFRVESPANAM